MAIEEIERTIRNELGNTVFLFIERSRASEFDRMLKESVSLWEETSERNWYVTFSNLDRARFCYRAEEFTASVFHSMRAAEKVLATIAVSLGLDPKREQWQVIIEQIESKIKALDALPKSQEKAEKQEFFSGLAMQLRYIKNAWRNHVMHARTDYAEKDSREIWWTIKRMVERASGQLEEQLET
jgi:HEPN domain-containing protein